MLAESLDIFLADLGVPSSFTVGLTKYTPLVIFNEPGEDVLGNRALSEGYEIIYRTSALPGLAIDSLIAVNGQTFAVREPPKKLDDGAFSCVRLEI